MRWSYAWRAWCTAAALAACGADRAGAQDADAELVASEATPPATRTQAVDAMASVLPSFDLLSGGQAGALLFYGGIDVWHFGFAGYTGVQWAPGNPNDDGFILRLIVSDGKKLVVVQRVDLDLNDPKTRELAYLDNRVSEVGLKWSPTQLEADLAMGIELGGMFNDDEREELLRLLDQAEVTTNFHFDDDTQYNQFQQFVSLVEQRYPGSSSFGAKLTQWVLQQLAAIDPAFSATS